MIKRKAVRTVHRSSRPTPVGPVRKAWLRCLTCGFLAVAWTGGPAFEGASSSCVRAQTAAPPPVAAQAAGERPGQTASPHGAEKEEVARRLARVQQAIQMLQSQTPPRVPPADLVLELESLRWLLLTYAEQASTVEQVRSLTAEKENLQSELDALRKFGLSETPPYSFLLLDETQDALNAARQRFQALELEVESRAGHRGRGPRGVQRQ